MNTKELTEKGFNKLNFLVNGVGGLHVLDEDTIKGFIKAVYKNGDELDLELFERLARQHNWRDTAINFVITKTNHVAEGGNVQLKNNKETGANIYQKIIDETS